MSIAEKENVIRILEYRSVEQAELTKPRGSHADVSASVSEILEAVRTEGDAALLRFTERYDHVRLESLQVTEEEWADGRFSDPSKRSACMSPTGRRPIPPPS